MTNPAAEPKTTASVIPADCPLRMGEAEAFARVREFFGRAGYDAAALVTLLGIADMSDLGKVDWQKIPLATLPPSLHLSLNLFLRRIPTQESEIASICGADTLAAMQALGLLRPSNRRPGHLVPTVWIYPVEGFVVVSDLGDDPDRDDFKRSDDIVFPAFYGGTLRFLQLLPDPRGGDALDLCGGSGIGAMVYARTAGVALGTDITPRSAYFAEFNARLNGSRMVSLCGDLYDPVAGRQFDVISAHPPFVPTLETRLIFRDGGETGEAVTCRIIEGLAQHLRVGGTCLILGFGRDTEDQTFEQRARDWLGEAGETFDVIFGGDAVLTIDDVANKSRNPAHTDTDVKRLADRLRELRTRQFVHGALFVRRHAERAGRPPLRMWMTREARAADFDRLFALRHRFNQLGFPWLATSNPRLAPHLELHARYTVQDGQLAVAELAFQTGRGFEMELEPETFLVPVIAALDGRRSVTEVLQQAHASGKVPQDYPLATFVEFISFMLERGFLEVDLPQ